MTSTLFGHVNLSERIEDLMVEKSPLILDPMSEMTATLPFPKTENSEIRSESFYPGNLATLTKAGEECWIVPSCLYPMLVDVTVEVSNMPRTAKEIVLI